MPDDPFSPEEIEQMKRDMAGQLRGLREAEAESKMRWITRGRSRFPEPQIETVDKAVVAAGKEPESFWTRFKKAAKQDVCEDGGVLNKQWQKWGDLSNEKVLKQFGAILVAMGFSGNVLQVMVVSLAVIDVHLGVKAFCMETE